jgi:hypothetical protein
MGTESIENDGAEAIGSRVRHLRWRWFSQHFAPVPQLTTVMAASRKQCRASYEKEFRDRRGRVVVSGKSFPPLASGDATNQNKVCADHGIRDAARMHVQRRMERRLRLVELDFQPAPRGARPAPADIEIHCKG